MATVGRDTPEPCAFQSRPDVAGPQQIRLPARRPRVPFHSVRLPKNGATSHLIHQDMSDSQRFPVAAHTLAYLAHKQATAPERAVSSAELAASMPTNPVVVRRVTALLSKAGLIATRTGAS